MIDPYNVAAKSFEESHLLAKLQKLVAVARAFESVEDSRSLLHSVAEFDLDDPETYNQVKADYELVRQTIVNKGTHALTGSMGVRVQPRTKGAGHGSSSRAFYARTSFVAHISGEGFLCLCQWWEHLETVSISDSATIIGAWRCKSLNNGVNHSNCAANKALQPTALPPSSSDVD